MSEAESLFGKKHVQRYRETDGEVGHIWKRGAKTLSAHYNRSEDGQVDDDPADLRAGR